MKRAKVTCVDCGAERFTFSRAPRCFTCNAAWKYKDSRDAIKKSLEDIGHTDVQFTGILNSGKISVTFTHAVCGTRQTWQASNVTKVMKADPNTAPCSKCGGKRRAAKATAGFVAKYGIDPARIGEWEIYRHTVRRLTERTYRLHRAEINPLNLIRGRSTYHLDHRMPIIEGFVRGLDPAALAVKENLQILPALDNLSKGRTP